MHVAHLSLHDYRSWPALELELEPGVTLLVGHNGQGKTNVVEAIDYLSSLSSHRVASDAPLVRQGATQAVVRAAVMRADRRAVLEVEINPGKSNRARINGSPLPKARELLGLLRTVVFAPDDLKLVKGDPSDRRDFLDQLMIQQTPRFAGTRSDYERVLKQRNSLLKTMRANRFSRSEQDDSALSTLSVWDANLARIGAEIMARRIELIEQLRPLLGTAYAAVARGARREDASVAYKPSIESAATDQHDLAQDLLAAIAQRRRDELDRGVTLVGPHRDELSCTIGGLPVKGYASHGESWSFALALRLASYELLRVEGDDPVLVLDDVFAELDSGRRIQLAELVGDAEQVLITAAVADDVPERLQGARHRVAEGVITRE